MAEAAPGLYSFLSLYGLALLTLGLAGLLIDLRRDARGDRMRLPSWNTSWVHFGFGAWLLIVGVYLAQLIGAFAISYFQASADLPMRALVMGLIFHGIVAAIILMVLGQRNRGLQLRFSPHGMAGGAIIVSILVAFGSGLALVIATSKFWEFILETLARYGLAAPAQPQELVAIFAECESGPVWVALILLAVVIAPVTEEFLFRGMAYRFLKGRFSPRIGLIASSALFALMHFNTYSFIPLLLIGMLCCRAYERSGNLLVPIGFHALFNANSVLLIHLQVAQGGG